MGPPGSRAGRLAYDRMNARHVSWSHLLPLGAGTHRSRSGLGPVRVTQIPGANLARPDVGVVGREVASYRLERESGLGPVAQADAPVQLGPRIVRNRRSV